MMYRLVFQVFNPHTNIVGSFFGYSLELIKGYVGVEVGNIPSLKMTDRTNIFYANPFPASRVLGLVTLNIALNAFRPIIVACSWDIEFLYYFKSMGKGGPRGVF